MIIYFIRTKLSFVQHVQDLLEKQANVKTIEEFTCSKEDDEKGTIYDTNTHRPIRPYQAHELFIVTYSFYRPEEKEAFEKMLQQGLFFEAILQVDVFTVQEEMRMQ